MWLKQCHKPFPRHHPFYRLDWSHFQSWVVNMALFKHRDVVFGHLVNHAVNHVVERVGPTARELGQRIWKLEAQGPSSSYWHSYHQLYHKLLHMWSKSKSLKKCGRYIPVFWCEQKGYYTVPSSHLSGIWRNHSYPRWISEICTTVPPSQGHT